MHLHRRRRQFPQLSLMQLQDAVQAPCQATVVRHQDQAGALGTIELQHQLEHRARGLVVEVAGGSSPNTQPGLLTSARATAQR